MADPTDGDQPHIGDVVSQVTVKALREFSTGDMQATDQPQQRDSVRQSEQSLDNLQHGEDSISRLHPADTEDTMRCDLDETDELEGDEEAQITDEDEEGDESDEQEGNELVVLDPDHPLMNRFQQALRTLLQKQLNVLKLDIKETITAVNNKQKEREDIGVELYGIQYDLANHQKTLENLQDELSKARQCRDLTEKNLAEVRKKYQDNLQLTNEERKRDAQLRAELENINLRIFYLQNAKTDVQSDIAVMKRAAEKAESEVVKAEETKRMQDLFVNRLVERLDQLRDDIALYDAQLEAQTAETRAVREALSEARMEIDAITVEKKQLFSAWNSALIGMRRRDEAHAAMTDALHQQQMHLLTIETEIDGFRRLVNKEQQENEKLTLQLNKVDGDIASVKRMIASSQAKFDLLKEEYATYTRVLQETEDSLNRAVVERTLYIGRLNELRKATEASYQEKVLLEDDILDKLREQLTADKATQYSKKIILKLRQTTKDLETLVASTENDIAKLMLEAAQVATQIDTMEKRKAELETEMKNKDEIIAKSQAEITRRNVEIKRKQDLLQQLNSEYDRLMSAAGGAEIGPLEVQISSLRKSIEAENAAITGMQQSWLRDQGELVHLSQEHDRQKSDVDLMIKQHTVLIQKQLRVEGEISSQKAEITQVEKDIHLLRIDLSRLDSMLFKEQGAENALQQYNMLMESHFMRDLKDAERESIELQDKLEMIREEKERLLNSLVEAERQIMLWEKKTQLAKETRAAVDADMGHGEIAAMRSEIHRMQLRYGQLMKQQEQMIQEMEKAVSRRETIAVRSEALSKNKSKKVVTKTSLNHEMTELKRKIKQTQQDTAECDVEIQDLKRQQQEISLQLDDRQVQIQQMQCTAETLDGDIDRLSELRQMNMADLLARQQKSKYYQQAKDGKYTRLCKTAASLANETRRQNDRMNEIVTIANRILHEHPQAQRALRSVVLTYGVRGLKIVENLELI